MQLVLREAGVESFVSGQTVSSVLPYLSAAVNAQVLVRQEDVDAALAAIAGFRAKASSRQSVPQPDDYALRAARAALWFWVFPPVLALVPWYLARTAIARRERPFQDRRRSRRNVWLAVVIGVAIPWSIILWLVYMTTTGQATWGS